MARTIQTHELTSFSIQDWTRGQRWGDAVAGDVEMDWTRLPSGGKRPWFLCPSCGRRCAVLYSLGSRIICRKCGRLSYESQYEPRHFRALRKAQKIRVRLGGSANMAEPFPSRPRYMTRRAKKPWPFSARWKARPVHFHIAGNGITPPLPALPGLNTKRN